MLSPTKKVELMMKSGLSVQTFGGKKVFATDGSPASLQRIFMFWCDPKLYTQLDVCPETKQQFIEAAMHAASFMKPDEMQLDFLHMFKKATGLDNYTADAFKGFSINIPDLIKISSVKPEPAAIAAEPFVTVPVAENLTATTVPSPSGLTDVATDTRICTGTNYAPVKTAVERTDAIIAAHKELTGIHLKSPGSAYKEPAAPPAIDVQQADPSSIPSAVAPAETMNDIATDIIKDIKEGKHPIRISLEFLQDVQTECSPELYQELTTLIYKNPRIMIPPQIDPSPTHPKFQQPPNHNVLAGDPKVATRETWDLGNNASNDTKVTIELSVPSSDITMIYRMLKTLEANGMDVITCKIG